jgi:ABC-2 type transport system permease protein
MESVTRAFYSRSDLDLILSSPIVARRLFSVRIAAIALSAMGMAVLLAGPFANVLALLGGAHWLSGYGVFAAMGAASAALAVALTVALFRLIGPRRTRFVAQVVAAVIGAIFVIGLQAGAILSYGSLSRVSMLMSDSFIASAPAIDSFVYWPARAILADGTALLIVAALGAAALSLAIAVFASRFGEHAIAATSVSPASKNAKPRAFRSDAPKAALRRKELALLRRDPWLMSQTLMQILYLLPPALLLWKNFGEGASALLLLAPVLVMAAGQLAGGLAWLAISGEDAPDFVATAPIPKKWIMQAKVEAVLLAVAVVFAPFVLAFALAAPATALVTAIFVGVSAASATLIQFWFRTQAKRSDFRRRHTSSRVATFAEAFSSITWAATAGLVAAGTWFALPVWLIALGVLAVTRFISPHRAGKRA